MLKISSRGAGTVISKFSRMRSAIHRENRQAMRGVVTAVHRDVARNGMTGHKGSHPFWGVTSPSGNTLGHRSGDTKKSIVARVIDAGIAVIGVVGSPFKHMRLHEFGGTVHGNPYLRIPTRAAQTGAGVDRMAGLSARGIAGGFLLRSKAGNLWIARRAPDSSPIFLYLLKTSIRLRARHIFRNSLNRMRPFIRQSFRNAAARIRAA